MQYGDSRICRWHRRHHTAVSGAQQSLASPLDLQTQIMPRCGGIYRLAVHRYDQRSGVEAILYSECHDFVPIGTKPVWLSVEEVKLPKMPLPPKRKAL